MAVRHLTNVPVRFLLAILLAVCSLTGAASAQQPIRVETKQVLVPAVVFDKDRLEGILKTGKMFDAIFSGQADAVASGVLVRGLTAADFQVLDDGKEQPVQSVTEEQSLYWDVRDDRGHHTEYMGPGGGKWSTTQWPPGLVGDIDPPQHYVIAYPLPESPEGSCHEIKVRVKGHNAIVFVRPEYCNIKYSGSDPIFGTTLGKQMEAFQASENKTMVNVSMTALSLHRKSGVSRVHIVAEWPWKQFGQTKKSGVNAVLGMVFDKQANTVARFSDLTEHEGGVASPKPDKESEPFATVEERYERQLDLPPGDYKLRVVLGDGKRFGRAEIPLIVGSYDAREFAISELSLCKQIDDFSSYGHESALPGAWTAKLPDSYIPLISNGMQFKPTSNTRFQKGESLYTYFEVYDPQLGTGETPAAIQIEIRVVNVATGAAVSAPESISAAQYIRPKDPVIPIGRGIDISRLPSGSYRLEIRATDSTGRTTPWRNATFTVE